MSVTPPPPASRWRRPLQAWLSGRLRRTESIKLTQRNIYILPTRAGVMFATTLITLLVASINYQLNLGYVLTFLLAGSGAVSMQLTHNTLRGLTMHLKPVAAVFAGEAAVVEVVLSSPSGARHGIGLKPDGAPSSRLGWIDVPAGGQASARVTFVPQSRGRHEVPTLCAETRFPLGLFRAWTVWRPAAEVLVYPRPERPPAPLPAAIPMPGGTTASRLVLGDEIEGIRAYRRGDPLKLVSWRKSAKAIASGGELVSRDTSASAHQELWLDWTACGTLALEERLSRLSSWVVAADRAGIHYGMRLPGLQVPRGQGAWQRRACLEALALWR